MDNYIKKIIYLGPTGSNSEFAVNKFMEKMCIYVDCEPVSTITKTIEVMENEPETTVAILPIENSIEGIVRETIDNLVKATSDIQIRAEFSIPICHCLISKGQKEDIKTIVSISQAVMQCKEYIANNFDKNVEVVLYTSTSGAAKFISQKDKSFAAIAPERCAYMYGLNIVEKEINDTKDNKTNFIVLSKADIFKEAKTRTLVAFTTENRPGALLEVLEIFKKYNLNMIYLESRPSKKVFGEYIFYAELDRGVDEIKEALSKIEERSKNQRILGSYCLL